jgi:hypothetical protein
MNRLFYKKERIFYIMKCYKGFNKDMTCHDFQYEENKEYTTDKAELCKSGFHACERPIDVLRYYPPNSSVFREVELNGIADKFRDNDSKVVGKKIKIGAEIGLHGLIEETFKFNYENSDKSKEKISNKEGGAASATGEGGAASATGGSGAASATGGSGAASATGWSGAASATGERGAASATGERGAASATGERGVASATGEGGAASAGHETAIAVAWGVGGTAKGVIGSHIVCAEWAYDNCRRNWNIVNAKLAIVDGKLIKEDVYYKLQNGELVEV